MNSFIVLFKTISKQDKDQVVMFIDTFTLHLHQSGNFMRKLKTTKVRFQLMASVSFSSSSTSMYPGACVIHKDGL